MKSLKDVINASYTLNAKVMMNVNGVDIEIKEILTDCLSGTIYLYDRELEDIEQ